MDPIEALNANALLYLSPYRFAPKRRDVLVDILAYAAPTLPLSVVDFAAGMSPIAAEFALRAPASYVLNHCVLEDPLYGRIKSVGDIEHYNHLRKRAASVAIVQAGIPDCIDEIQGLIGDGSFLGIFGSMLNYISGQSFRDILAMPQLGAIAISNNATDKLLLSQIHPQAIRRTLDINTAVRQAGFRIAQRGYADENELVALYTK